MTRPILIALGAASIVLAAVLRPDAAVADRSVALAVAGRTSATPSIAAEKQLVVVAWSATARGATDIFTAISRDQGRTFATPVRVNTSARSANVSGEQPPRVVLVPRGGDTPAITVVWTAKTNAGTRIVTARSENGGRSFGIEQMLSGSVAPGNRGWQSAAANGKGDGVVMWLDHRELAEGSAAAKSMTHDHAAMNMPPHDPTSVGKEQLSKLYFQRLDGSGWATALTGGVCYCCKTSIIAGSDQMFYAVWRHVYPGNIRDIAFTMSRDGGRTFAPPTRVSDDRWMLDGCPENGPAVTASGKDVIVVWPTLVSEAVGSEPTLQLFSAVTREGTTFTPRARMPTEGVPRHPQVASVASGSVLAVWDEATSGRRRVVVSSKGPTKSVFAGRRIIGDLDTAEYPVIAGVDSSAVVAWTSGGADRAVIRVIRLEP